jgi:hypothetical protein
MLTVCNKHNDCIVVSDARSCPICEALKILNKETDFLREVLKWREIESLEEEEKNEAKE